MLTASRIADWAGRHAYLVLGAASVTAVGLSLAVGLTTSHDRILDAGQTTIQRLALATERQIVTVFESANQILESTIYDLDRLVRVSEDTPLEIQRMLDANVKAQSIINNIGLTDASGQLVYAAGSRLEQSIFVGDRDWFRVHKDQQHAGLHISTPTESRFDGSRILPVSRRLTDSSGNFTGVVVALINTAAINDLFKGMLIGGDATVTLIRKDGMLLAREPGFNPAQPSVANSVLFTRYLPQSPVGSYRVVTFLDNVDRLVSYRASDRFPVVVSLAFTVSDILQHWRADLYWYAGVSLLCALAIMALAILVELSQRRQRRVEEELRQSQKMEALGQLTGGIAHDFNNRLAAMMLNVELIAERVAHDPAAQASLEGLNRSVVRAAELTNQLLAFSRRRPQEPRPLDLNLMIDGMKELGRRTLGERVELRLDLDPGLGLVTIDPAQLENALLNLMINARDAMPDGGRITIRTRSASASETGKSAVADIPAGPYAVVTVADTGVGMSADVLKRATEPFFTTKEAGKGTGLGLSMVYGFAKQSNGKIAIESSPGRGTVVSLYLPMGTGAPAAPDHVAAPPPAAPSGTGMVLLVDDDDDVRHSLAAILRGLGYRVAMAADGPSALRILDEEPAVDILITDLGLPQGMNGVDLARQALGRRPQLRVVYMSGNAAAVAVAEARRGEIDFLQKPFKTMDLVSKLQAAPIRPAPA